MREREKAGAELLLSQPEIVAWLGLSEAEIVTWSKRNEDESDDDESARVA